MRSQNFSAILQRMEVPGSFGLLDRCQTSAGFEGKSIARFDIAFLDAAGWQFQNTARFEAKAADRPWACIFKHAEHAIVAVEADDVDRKRHAEGMHTRRRPD